MKIRRTAALLIAPFVLFGSTAFAADAAALWAQHCASCHGKDGSGNTAMGKKSGARDYRDAKVQAEFSDAKAAEIIKSGVQDGGKVKMKGFGDKLSDADVKALVAYVRSFKK